MAKRFLAVDYGRVRIGLAVGDSAARLAQPLKIIAGGETATKTIAGLADELGSDELVIGLPRGLDGQETAQTAEVRQFAADLAELGRPVHLVDEAATSQLAKQRSGRSDKLDAEAAAIILQDYLDQI